MMTKRPDLQMSNRPAQNTQNEKTVVYRLSATQASIRSFFDRLEQIFCQEFEHPCHKTIRVLDTTLACHFSDEDSATLQLRSLQRACRQAQGCSAEKEADIYVFPHNLEHLMERMVHETTSQRQTFRSAQEGAPTGRALGVVLGEGDEGQGSTLHDSQRYKAADSPQAAYGEIQSGMQQSKGAFLEHRLYLLETAEAFLCYSSYAKTLYAADYACNAYFYCWADDAFVAIEHEAHPLRLVLGSFAARKGALLAHSAAVGFQGKGVLLAGFGGVGKTTLALAALHEGMQYVADDYLFIKPGVPAQGFPLYSTGFINPDSLEKLPLFQPYTIKAFPERAHKTLIDLAAFNTSFADGIPLCALMELAFANNSSGTDKSKRPRINQSVLPLAGQKAQLSFGQPVQSMTDSTVQATDQRDTASLIERPFITKTDSALPASQIILSTAIQSNRGLKAPETLKHLAHLRRLPAFKFVLTTDFRANIDVLKNFIAHEL